MAPVARWSGFDTQAPELATFGTERLSVPPAYLATVRAGGVPRVHPVTPILGHGGLYLFMEPTSPKLRDIRERGWYALHNGVPDVLGTGGEFTVTGQGIVVEDGAARVAAARAASYEPADRYVLVELLVTEARCNGYDGGYLPVQRRWREAR